MIFSVWNYRTRTFDYYQGGQATGTHAGTPPTPLITPPIGATPDEAAWRLPAGATKIGTGTVARGRIASLGDLSSSSLLIPIALGLGAWLLWRNR